MFLSLYFKFLYPFLVAPRITPFVFEGNPVQSEEYVTIQCTVGVGDMPLNISWLFNGQVVTTFLGISVTSVGKRSSSLTLESVSYENAGNYTCRGENRAGRSEYTASLLVNGLFTNTSY